MDISILSAESLGVRGLCCYVETGQRNILIDPGFALGYMRHNLLPHPIQVAMAEKTRRKIIGLWGKATDIVISHFHGDHVPLVNANPYQLHAKELSGLNSVAKIWSKNPDHLSPNETLRKESLKIALGIQFLPGEGVRDHPLHFSLAVPHGDPDLTDESVMMSLIEEEIRFLHAPDIQLLHDQTVSRILEWRPDILLAGGPPLYLSRLTKEQIDRAWRNALRLARNIDLFIIDHHLLRCTEGITWIEKLSASVGKPVLCAADFMCRRRMFMEAERENFYRNFPVPEGWHEDYAKGKATTEHYRQ
ncbi:MAG: MBL fold metallo-hydrolase [Deltaproteobacteria bacterium]|nr:MBL fold metallo-hydrolase [Deltaproteobacteria bacterium]